MIRICLGGYITNVGNEGIMGCRVEWRHRTPHGEALWSCHFVPADNSYVESAPDSSHCMVDVLSCDAGYESKEKGFFYDYYHSYRCWHSTYEFAKAEHCIPAGIGKYSPDGALDAIACPDGTSTHIDAAISADDCAPLCRAGMSKIHIGNHVFNIWPDKQTTPALNIMATNGDICYVNMVAGAGTVNIRLGDNQYHISN